MSKYAQRKVSAFSAGRLAKREGKDKRNNPYKSGLAKVWHVGYQEEKNK